MKRVQNTEDFVKKAKIVHGDMYDYSKTNYIKSSEKVKIICPTHGEFLQTPNAHLSGRGCKLCGRERTKNSLDDMIKKANKIHNNKYDYSLVVYKNMDTKVKIICPIHGIFEQSLGSHINSKQECPKCASKKGGSKRSGKNNVAHRQDVKDKKKKTCLERYGTKTWAESDEGRKIQRDLVLETDMLDRMKNTCQEKYGHDFWTQSKEGKEKLSEIMSSDEMREKVKQGYIKKYGCHYMQSDEGRAKAKAYIDDERYKKMKKSMIEKYGVMYAGQFPAFIRKSWETKRKNGTFNTSKPEKTLYLLLCDTFGKENVKTQYKDKIRYPFYCDFYIKSEDLFIELNAHWSHGEHFYDDKSVEDNKLVQKWKCKAKKQGSRYYYEAIDVWTKRDILKRDTALKNNLNYIVFWKQDLSDAKEYLQKYSRP